MCRLRATALAIVAARSGFLRVVPVVCSLLHRASPLLRNAATSRAVAIIRHLFALENLKTLFSQQEKQHQEEGSPRKQSGNTHDQQQSLQAQHASTPPQFVARLESAMSLRSTGTTYFPVSEPVLVGLLKYYACMQLAAIPLYPHVSRRIAQRRLLSTRCR